MKNMYLWKWNKQGEKLFIRTWVFMYSEAELFLAIVGLIVG